MNLVLGYQRFLKNRESIGEERRVHQIKHSDSFWKRRLMEMPSSLSSSKTAAKLDTHAVLNKMFQKDTFSRKSKVQPTKH